MGSLPLALPNSNNLPLCQWSQCEGRWADAHPHVDSSDEPTWFGHEGCQNILRGPWENMSGLLRTKDLMISITRKDLLLVFSMSMWFY